MRRGGEIITFAMFVFAGLVPPFSSFFLELLLEYGLRMSHLGPNSVIALAAFAHLCEAFVRVMPSVAVFRRLFKVSRACGGDPVGSVWITIRSEEGYIEYSSQLKIEKWRRQWFVMVLDSVPRRLRFARHEPVAVPAYWDHLPPLEASLESIMSRIAALGTAGLSVNGIIYDFLLTGLAPLRQRLRPVWLFWDFNDAGRTRCGP